MSSQLSNLGSYSRPSSPRSPQGSSHHKSDNISVYLQKNNKQTSILSTVSGLPTNALVWNYSSDTDDGSVYIDRNQRSTPCTQFSRYLHERYDHPGTDNPLSRVSKSTQPLDPDWQPKTVRPTPQPAATKQQYIQNQHRLHQQQQLLRNNRHKNERRVRFEQDPRSAMVSLHLAQSKMQHEHTHKREREKRRQRVDREKWRYMYGDEPYPYDELQEIHNNPRANTHSPTDLCSCGGDDVADEEGRVCGGLVRGQNKHVLAYALLSVMILVGVVTTTVSSSLLDTAYALPKLFYSALLLGVLTIIDSSLGYLGVCFKAPDVITVVAVFTAAIAFASLMTGALSFLGLNSVVGNVVSHEFPHQPSEDLVLMCQQNARILASTMVLVGLLLGVSGFVLLKRGSQWVSAYTKVKNNKPTGPPPIVAIKGLTIADVEAEMDHYRETVSNPLHALRNKEQQQQQQQQQQLTTSGVNVISPNSDKPRSNEHIIDIL